MRLPQDQAVFCRKVHIALCFQVVLAVILHKSQCRIRQFGQSTGAGRGSLWQVPCLCKHCTNRESCCILCLGLTNWHHATLVLWYPTCSDRLLLGRSFKSFHPKLVHFQLGQQLQVLICSTSLEWSSLCWSEPAPVAIVPLYSLCSCIGSLQCWLIWGQSLWATTALDNNSSTPKIFLFCPQSLHDGLSSPIIMTIGGLCWPAVSLLSSLGQDLKLIWSNILSFYKAKHKADLLLASKRRVIVGFPPSYLPNRGPELLHKIPFRRAANSGECPLHR